MDTVKWPKMPEQQRKRTLYVMKFLETSSDKGAAELSGLGVRHTQPRIADHIHEYGPLAEAPHLKISPKYTEDVMKAALN